MVMHPMITSLSGENLNGLLLDSSNSLVLAKDSGASKDAKLVIANTGQELFPRFVEVSKRKSGGEIVGGVVSYKWSRPGEIEYILSITACLMNP